MKYFNRSILVLSLFVIIALSNCAQDDEIITLASVSETTISEITETGAKLEASILDDGGGEIFTKGFAYNTTGNPTEGGNNLVYIVDIESINALIINLKSDTRYYVRAFAINSAGIAYGEEVEFSTNKEIVAAIVTTDLISEIEINSVKAEGTIVDEGNGSVIERGFVWSSDENPTIDLETKKIVDVGIGSFSTTIENLLENTTYFVRAYAINEFGASYGEEKTFTTLSNNTLLEELELNSDLSIFTSEVKNHSDLVSILNNEDSEYTLFVPNNDAMNSLFQIFGITSFETFRYELVKGILFYHLTPQLLYSSDLSDPASFRTLQGEDFTIDVDRTIVSGATSRASIIEKDRNASNGVMHIMDQIIIPPTIGSLIISSLGTLAQPIVLGKDFSILYEGIKKADGGKEAAESILGTLQSASDLTFFAPTNATFASASITADSWTSEQWNVITRNHIVVGQGGETNSESLTEENLIDGSQFTPITGGTLQFIHGTPQNGTGIYIDSDNDYDASNPASTIDGEVVLFDVVDVSNGRLHVIAGILVPET